MADVAISNAATAAGGTVATPPPAGNGEPPNAGRTAADNQEPAWLGPRLERAARKAREDFLAELGLAPDEAGGLKDVLAKHREGESESAKLKRDLAQREKELQKEREANARHERERRERLVQDSIRSAFAKEAAAGRRVIRPDEVSLLLSDPRQPSHVGVAEDGQVAIFERGQPVRGKDAAAFVKEYLDAAADRLEPIMQGGGGGTRIGGSDGARETAIDLRTATREQKEAAVRADPRYKEMLERARKKG